MATLTTIVVAYVLYHYLQIAETNTVARIIREQEIVMTFRVFIGAFFGFMFGVFAFLFTTHVKALSEGEHGGKIIIMGILIGSFTGACTFIV